MSLLPEVICRNIGSNTKPTLGFRNEENDGGLYKEGARSPPVSAYGTAIDWDALVEVK